MVEPYRLGLYEKSMPNFVPLREKLAACALAGFDYLELSIDETEEKLQRLDWDDWVIAGLLQEMMKTGIPISSICLSGQRKYPMGHPDLVVRRRSMDILKKAVLLAERLSVRIIQLAGYDVYYEKESVETRQFFEQNLKEAVEFASSRGIILAFETMETPFMDTVAKAMEYVNKVNSPYLQVYPDLGNLTNAAVSTGGGVTTDLRRGQGHLAALHLKETKPGVFREVPFGTGHVNFGEGAAEALRQGVRMFVGEFWYSGAPSWEEEVFCSGRFLRDKLQEAVERVQAAKGEIPVS